MRHRCDHVGWTVWLVRHWRGSRAKAAPPSGVASAHHGAGAPVLRQGVASWHRRCTAGGGRRRAEAAWIRLAVVDSCHAVVLRGATGDLEAVFPFRANGDRFWSAPVPGVVWAFGDLGCPDHLDLLASPEADLDALVGALETVPWVVIRLANVAEQAGNIERFRAACERRGWTVRRRLVGRCPYLELPGRW